MSGFEIAGTVLGALPLVIEAAKYYRKIYSRLRDIRENLGELIAALENESVILRNTCELVLEGIAPHHRIQSLIENPLGPDWEPYERRIRSRLWSSLDGIKHRLESMDHACQELKDKLHVKGKQGSQNKGERMEMRRRFVLAWNWGDYQSIVKRLQSGNGALQTLVSQSEKLGSSRGRRSQDRFVKLIRRLSQAIFEAICTATSCNCPQPHSLCLQLVPREAVLLDSDKEDEIALSHNFHVMFNPKIANQTSSNSGGQHSNSMTMFQPNRWESLHIRAAKPKPKSAASPVPTAPPSGQGQTSKLSHRLSEIRTFLSRLRHSTNSVTQPTANLTNITTSSELSLIADLCQMVSTRGKSAAKACYGYIEDESYIFGVHDRDERFRLDSSITLGRVLESEDLKEKLRERLQIALAISTGILHLHDTEWLTRPWAPDDVMLLSEENADASRYPFVVNQVRPTTTSGASSARNASLVRPTNLKVVSLGAVLAQIAIGRRVGGLDVPSTPDDQAIGAVRNELEQLELQVEICAGKEYKEALQWCCRNIFELATLADHQHAYDFYEHVVKKLQSSLNHVERRLGL